MNELQAGRPFADPVDGRERKTPAGPGRDTWGKTDTPNVNPRPKNCNPRRPVECVPFAEEGRNEHFCRIRGGGPNAH